tara:strand:+ start:148 stop:342 length:195 start_codon:yes stop_codon:yes gene_type:complete
MGRRNAAKQQKRCANAYVFNARLIRLISKTYTGKRGGLPDMDLVALLRISVPLCVAACVVVYLL